MPRGPVIFDLDGTLIDSAPDLTEALNRVLAAHRLPPMDEAAVRHMVGEGAMKLIERGFAAAGRPFSDTPPESFRTEFLAHYAECLTDRTRPNDGAVAALDALAGSGARLAVCTNKPAGLSETILDRLGLGGRFDAVLGGDSLPVRKPDPAPLHAAIAGAGGNGGGGAVLVGDSETDVKCARAAGVPVLVVSFGYTRIPPRELGADAVIDHFDELLPALEAVTGA